MNEGETMMKYVVRIQEMAERLNSIEASVQEMDIVMTLLDDLPEIYGNLIVALGITATDLKLENVCTHLLNEEIRREGSKNSSNEEIALMANKKFTKFQKRNKKYPTVIHNNTCRYCGKENQIEINQATINKDYLFMIYQKLEI